MTESWRRVQIVAWISGAAILAALVLRPEVGLAIFWNALIPALPAILVFAPGVWRNACPIGTMSMLPGRFRLSASKKITPRGQGRLMLASVVLLLAIVPLRRVALDSSGPATALAIVLMVSTAVAMGFFFDGKSGWCASLCPVRPVEKLYGSAPAVVVRNIQCGACSRCVARCPDSTVEPLRRATPPFQIAFFAGGFPGFVWGWFQVPIYRNGEGWGHLDVAYGLPLAGFAVTLVLFLLLRRLVPERGLIRFFAALAIGCYYWFRLPALVGLGVYPGDGMLIDLSDWIWFPAVSRLFTTSLFAWWFLASARVRQPWSLRPESAWPARA